MPITRPFPEIAPSSPPPIRAKADLDLIEVDCVAEFIGECRARLQIDATRSDSAATRVRDNSALPAVAADFIGGGPAIIPDLDIAAKDGVVIRDRPSRI